MKKFEFTAETRTALGRTLHRIKALVSFGDVTAGELGGFVESEANLDQSGNAWVLGNALVDRIGAIFWLGAVGSRNDTTTFFKCADNKIHVKCGCFFGDLDEFADKVKQTHGENEYGRVYRLAIEMAKERIWVEEAKP